MAKISKIIADSLN
jgi:hypothetical protein